MFSLEDLKQFMEAVSESFEFELIKKLMIEKDLFLELLNKNLVNLIQ